MKNVTSIEDSVSLIGIGEMLRIGRQIRRMTAVVCMSIMIFFAMTLVPPIASADCPDANIACFKDYKIIAGEVPEGKLVGKFTTGACWHWYTIICTPCASADDLNKKCNDMFPKCEGRCTAEVELW